MNAAAGLGVSSFLLLLLEIGLRLFGLVPADQVQGAPLRTWDQAPGVYEPRQRVHDRNRPELPFTVTIDEWGFRSTGAPAGREDALGLLCLGDSYTFGAGVDDEETWPSVLQRLLDRDRSDAIRVINGGVPGFTVADERMLLEKVLPRLSVDAVLVEFTQNDLSDLTKGVPNFVQMRDNARLKSMPVIGPSIRVLLQSAIVIGLQRTLAQSKKRLGHHAAIPRVPTKEALSGPEADALWARYEQELSKLVSVARSRAIPVGVINYASEFQLHDAANDVSPLAAIAGRLQVPYLDLTPAMRELREKGERAYLLPLDEHPSALGYERAAEEIERWLRPWFPAPAGSSGT